MTEQAPLKVWDLLVRIFHWSLVTAFITAYLTEDDFLTQHTWAGYAVLGLVLFRVVYGFIGTRYARFSSFVTSPRVIWQYLRDTVAFRARHYPGHNPAGGAMIMLMLITLVLTCLSGIAAYGAVESAGPLGNQLGMAGEFWEDVLKETHEVLANFMVLLIVTHVFGVIASSLLHRENLIKAMLTGYKSTGMNSQQTTFPGGIHHAP